MEEWLDFDENSLAKETPFAVFLYTPLCGTCKVAERMLTIVQELVPQVRIKKMNLNYFPKYANQWEIQSVPCLLLFKNGKIDKKIYAFQSVDFVYNELKSF